ncbi:electron transport complex subunit E [Halieaceae bacterium IMCC14734]|uniref:Ion-translocating oxidoreductase complex subunit E n=1 Tax=Candidatus Litorirhabdus singularis TaxID=2518993 RepID=A0ABT3TNL1_9GAMM|nr:electron transport complex subunit E [Candidatus Litorirhabdus singularis]MCX2982964.1 electron transport complex subunit E [Candidatus Litorirhabdus singularis]
MAETSYKELSINGLWKNNPAIVQLLGLCPLLAVTGSVVNAIGLGLATTMVLICSNTAVSLIRNVVTDAVRLPAFVMIIAASVTCIELLMQAYTYELYQILGIFLPLITTNCVILGRADAFASKNALLPSFYDGFIMGLGFMVILVLLGGLRELVGTGALFANMDLLFGPGAASWELVLVDDYKNFLLAILPPGAFIFTGLIIALKNRIDSGLKARADALKEKPVKGAKRVRVTGNIS